MDGASIQGSGRNIRPLRAAVLYDLPSVQMKIENNPTMLADAQELDRKLQALISRITGVAPQVWISVFSPRRNVLGRSMVLYHGSVISAAPTEQRTG